jgi:hypothetical protein
VAHWDEENVMVQRRLARLAESARWFVFATAGDDQRRSMYARALLKLRAADVGRRRSAVASLPVAPMEIDDAVGFRSCDGAVFGGTAGVVEEVQRLAAASPPEPSRSGKPYLFDLALQDLDPTSAVLRFGLDGRVLACVSRYLGMVPRLTGVYVLRSTYVEGPPDGSRLFHSDWEAVRQVKIFVHCSDVEPENGPLTAVRSDASRRVRNALHYRYGGSGFRIPDDRIRPLLRPGDVTDFIGPAGAMTFIDTSSCLHRGSRISKGAQNRTVVQYQYMTPDAFDLVLRYRSYRGPAADGAALSETQRMVVGR